MAQARKSKSFDCVAMKNRVQAALRAEKKRVGKTEQNHRHKQWLETSDDPLARWWRKGRKSVRKSPAHNNA